MRIFKFLARLVLAITLAGVAAKANAQSIDELYQAAKKEGELSLNGGGLAGLYEPWVREFERRFPGIKVKLTADFSNILAPIIDREIAERKLSVDLTIFQTLQDYDRWKKQGVLMSFKPEGWDQIHQSLKDPDGQYVGVAVYALSYAYNTQAIAGIDVPRSAQDFLKPEFNGPSAQRILLGSERVGPFHCEAGFADLRGIRRCNTGELRSDVIDDVKIAVGPVVISQTQIGADRLRVGSIHLDETGERQEATEGIVSLHAGQHHGEITIGQRQSKSIPGFRA